MTIPLVLLMQLTRLLGAETSQTLKTLTVLPDQSRTLQGRDAITVVFNSPVIALGSDWNTQEFDPFRFVGAKVPGKIRWVTTSIARYDPDLDWPPDLDFQVEIVATDFKVCILPSN
jgi:hypothetical protein